MLLPTTLGGIATKESTSSTKAGGLRAAAMDLIQVLVIAVVLAVAVRVLVEPVRVSGLSMYPTLHDGDYLLASPIPYWIHRPQRGDIIILKDPQDPSENLVKRIVALPGDRIMIRNGHVYIDGKLLNEPYINEPWTLRATWPPDGVEQVPPGEYFVMGDNRNVSLDSRVFGPVPGADIEGEAWCRLWPIPDAGLLSGERPILSSIKNVA
jgi:signal peptidase I